MRLRRTFALFVLVLAVGACGGDKGSSAAGDSGGTGAISIKSFAFHPASITVSKGATVKLTNDDSATHTWTADDSSWDAGEIPPGSSATHVFDTTGTFSYHCKIHGTMKGTVVVR